MGKLRERTLPKILHGGEFLYYLHTVDSLLVCFPELMLCSVSHLVKVFLASHTDLVAASGAVLSIKGVQVQPAILL